MSHISVLLDEICDFAQINENSIIVDCTFGAGGYSRAFLQKGAQKVIAFDRDSEVFKFARELEREFPKKFQLIHSEFSKLANELPQDLHGQVDAVVFDLGVSSMQIDNAERGFSFQKNAEIDMRMGKNSRDVKKFLNDAEEEQIANVIYELGEEHFSRRIASEIVKARKIKEISETKELADIVSNVYGSKAKAMKIHPATKTFQALRIWANDELTEIEQALVGALKVLKKGGRILVVSFHGLEDVIIKNFFKKNSGLQQNELSSDDFFGNLSPLKENSPKVLKIVTKKVVKPSREEIKANARARSSRLRVAEKI